MSPQNILKTVIFASLICGSGAYGAQQLDSKGWTKDVDEFEGTVAYVSKGSLTRGCIGDAADVLGTVEGEVDALVSLQLRSLGVGLEDPIEKGTLRMRADEGILDLPTVCSSDYQGSGYFLTCQSLVLSHEAKELAKTAYLRLDTPSKNFDMKPDNGCSRILSGINQLGRDFYEVTTGDTSLGQELDKNRRIASEARLAEEKKRESEKAAALKKAEEKKRESEKAAAQKELLEEKERKESDEYLPIVKVQPQYPRRALSRGLAGWAVVEFTVTELGRVKDPVVIENCAFVKHSNRQKAEDCSNSPNKVFDKSALKAAGKFLYEPRKRNGTPVQTKGVQNKITYDLG